MYIDTWNVQKQDTWDIMILKSYKPLRFNTRLWSSVIFHLKTLIRNTNQFVVHPENLLFHGQQFLACFGEASETLIQNSIAVSSPWRRYVKKTGFAHLFLGRVTGRTFFLSYHFQSLDHFWFKWEVTMCEFGD